MGGDHPGMRRRLPSATVTFLFTDVEGSTKLLHELGAEAYAEALAEHRRSCGMPALPGTVSRSTHRATPSSLRSRRRQQHSSPLGRSWRNSPPVGSGFGLA